MNLTMLLEMAAQGSPDRVAVTAGDGTMTYQELWDHALRYAGVLGEQDVDCLVYLGENSCEAVAALFGAAVAGVPYVPVNYRWTDAQIATALDSVVPAAVLTDSACAGRVPTADNLVRIAAPARDQSLREVTPAATTENAPAVLLFTSGTSGTPKTAVLRNRHLVPYVLGTVEFLNAAEDEAILVSVPPYHIAAVSSVLTSVFAGRRMVQLVAFEAEAWVALARSERVTQAMVVPTMLDRILDVVEADGGGLPALRHLSYGGGRMPPAVVERTMNLLPQVDLVNAYGLTETSSTITLLSPEDHRAALASTDPEVRARLGSVGRALPSVEIEIRDGDGTVLPNGAAGEVWVRGDQVSGEYLTHKATTEGGWYPTADHGHLDAAGFLFLHGRLDDVIVRGGENLSPSEIEDRLAAHPAVAEAAVVGVPDREWGERVEAVVVLNADGTASQEELQEWVRSTLRSTRVPAAIHQRPELPYNETGKLLRRVLRDDLASASA